MAWLALSATSVPASCGLPGVVDTVALLQTKRDPLNGFQVNPVLLAESDPAISAPSGEALLIVTAAFAARSVPLKPTDVTRTVVAWGRFQTKWPGASAPSARLAESNTALAPVTFTIAVDVAGTEKLN